MPPHPNPLPEGEGEIHDIHNKVATLIKSIPYKIKIKNK